MKQKEIKDDTKLSELTVGDLKRIVEDIILYRNADLDLKETIAMFGEPYRPKFPDGTITCSSDTK